MTDWRIASTNARNATWAVVRKLGGQFWQPDTWDRAVINTLKRKPVLPELVLIQGLEPYRLRTIPGIYDIAQDMDGEYATLPDEVVQHWKSWLERRREKKTGAITYAEGTRLRIIKDGPAYGLQAIARHTRPHRARNGFVQVELPDAGFRAVELSVQDVETI